MLYTLSDDLIDKIKENNDIVEVISDYIELNRAGANYKACCPFHKEKTPSFMVSPTKQIYHCFGCGEGGDVISFISKYLNVDFVEAAKILADRAGIELEKKDENNEIKIRNEVLFQINREAAIFFYKNLRNNPKAVAYLRNRGIDYETIKNFGLGFALDNWDDLKRYLVKKGYEEKLIYKAGLIVERNNKNGYYNRFRNRVIFPIKNNRNKIIGFGGRVIDDTLPKYLNSPDTPIFNKRYNLYGINNVIKYSEDEKVFLAEGYMDVITLFNHGIKNAVASLGTAFTEYQAKLLKKYRRDVYICYDSDEAGQNAVNSAFEILNRYDIKAKVVIFDRAKDPDEYLRKYGINMFNELVRNSLGFIDYKIHYYKKKYDLQTTSGKIDFTKEITKLLSNIKSSVEKDVYIKKISQETGISPEAINRDSSGFLYSSKDKYIKRHYRYTNKDKISPVKTILKSGYMTAENSLLNLIITDKTVFDKINDEFKPKDFLDKIDIKIAEKIYDIYEKRSYIDLADLKEICNDKELNKLEVILDLDIKISYDSKEKAVKDYMSVIKRQSLKLQNDKIKNQINEIEIKKDKSVDDIKKLKLLLQQLIKIKEKIRLHDKFH
ncbi:DNA primase [Abyssisolibacter fermentans]|uniref:DNA primase n=1 Tax=Abyssisolibacter fermentans TaxID=1766203 RepID=UPI00082A3F3D|nr:DNA primase [Abyssisolibacter fermentans]